MRGFWLCTAVSSWFAGTVISVHEVRYEPSARREIFHFTIPSLPDSPILIAFILLSVDLFCRNIPCVRKADLRLIAFCVAYLALPTDRVTDVIRMEEEL